VALERLNKIDHQLREKLKLTSYMRRHALLDAVQAEGNQARVGRTIGLSRQRAHDMVERAQFERLHKIEPPLGESAV
jgi:molybdenum-dependent DNA-binding transcriptional regulator ModE